MKVSDGTQYSMLHSHIPGSDFLNDPNFIFSTQTPD